MKLIIVPEKCYAPEAVLKNKNIFGPKFYSYNITTLENHRMADINDLKILIKKLELYEAGIIGIGSINQASVNENKPYNPFLPSNRMFFNTLFLNTDEMLKFTEDKDLDLQFLSGEFQDEPEKTELIDYKTIFDIKVRKYKLIYESFRALHINNNTDKAKRFHSYVNQNGENLHKLALFIALQDFLTSEDSKYVNWHEWPKVYQNPNSEAVLAFEKNNSEIIEFYKFLQWQTYMQFESVITSYGKKLDVGICIDLPLCIDINGAEIWMNQEYFAEKTEIKSKFNDNLATIDCPIILPLKFIESAYSYFSDILRPNMIFAGAINLLNFNYLLNPKWTIISDDDEKTININYPVKDLLGIIALESKRNNCMVMIDMKDLSINEKEMLKQVGIYDEAKFEFEEIFDENQLKKYFEQLQSKTPLELNKIKPSSHIIKIPNSTYRLQFNSEFNFNKAKEIIPYLKQLGISHIYASPLQSPRKGSLHGYDIVDHSSINQEAGTIEEFNSFVDTLHYYEMGLILDIVPNHMGIGKENKWWMDVLENGQSSEYAHYFDIDWNPVKRELNDKILIPVLGDYYGNIVTSGQLNFKFSEETGKLSINYYEHEFPLNPSSYPAILEHRLDVLKTRLGSLNKDFLEYLSIITVFKNLPKHISIEYEKRTERIREKNITFERLSKLCSRNYIIKGFIDENIADFQCSKDNPVSIERVHSLLEEQVYRLAFWRVSSEEINYRRFFDINDLAAVCVEKPDVFTNINSFIINLIENKKIDGLRLDHTDGLLDPVNFYKKLQFEIAKKMRIDFDINEENLLSSEKLPFYIIAEKILALFEKLTPNRAIHGTVGYDFLNLVNGLFINSKNKSQITNIYHKFIGKELNIEEMVIECKKLIMNTSLTAEINVLSNHLNQISESYLYLRDYTLNSIKNALIEIISCFPVYRTYITKDEKSDTSKDHIKLSISLAKKSSLRTDTSIFDFIEKFLLLEYEPDIESEKYQNILKFALKFQQYTGPLMAKGFEDTFFYRYNRLIALNEVGGESDKFGSSKEEFHQANLDKMNTTPHSMLTTSTHDTKRSEDVRTRICVISEIPDEWQKAIEKWSSINFTSDSAVTIDKNDEYLIYQILIGIWPMEELTSKNCRDLINRIENYILKAAREAKVHTSWININSEYEDALCNFIKKILNYPDNHSFWKEFFPIQKKIATAGYLNSISQCVLKLSSPGVPDIYQGNEIFQFNLVDPDNRMAVDYSFAISLLKKIQPVLNFDPLINDLNIFNEILMPFESGALKLFFTATTLNFRNKNSDLFRLGKYIPVEVIGEKAENIVSFARLHNDQAMITVTPRLICNLISFDNPLQIKKEILGNTKIIIPEEIRDFSWEDIYTKENKKTKNNKILVSEIFKILPSSILSGKIYKRAI
jgi:(1->4)-alpha-D-glucan 1-alpha-D-glucosylmutase